MRLHRLSMTAFGPFAGTEVVDFDALSASGLFLLHGPTGAGKTSVLDAVCYALYGQVPGARALARARLRSDHAPTDREPRVQLELTVADRRIEVTRTPEWARPKRRGTGVTNQPATTHVRELLAGEWVPQTIRNDEAAQLLLDLMGMGLEQFTKVVLLPQGDFAAFLRADSESRRALLGRLFTIDRFTGVESALAEERRRLAVDVEAARQQTGVLLARASEAFAGLPDTDEPEVDVQVEAKAARRVAALLERAESLGRAAQVELELCAERATTAHIRLDQAIALTARQQRRSQITAELTAVDDAAQAHDEAVRRIGLARRAAPLSGLLEALDAARERVEQAALTVRIAREAAPPAAREADALGLRDVVAAHRGALAALDGAGERLADLAATRARIDELGAEHTHAAAGGAAAEAARSRSAGELGRAHAAHQAAVTAAADLDPATAARAVAVRVAEQVIELHACDHEVHIAQQALTTAVDTDHHAREYQLTLWQRRVADIAGELAVDLQPGQPCQVCGCREHPAAATVGAEHVGRGDVEAATAAADFARARRQAAEATLSRHATRRCELLAHTEGIDASTAQHSLAAAQTRLAVAETAGQRMAVEAAAIDAARVELRQAEAAQQTWADAASRSSAAIIELTRASAAASADLELLRGADVDVHQRSIRLQAEVAAADELLDALRLRQGAEAAVSEQQARLLRACSQAGFGDIAHARAAVVPPGDVEQLAAAVEVRQRRRGDLLALLADPELAGAGSQPLPDLPAARDEVAHADRGLQRAASQSTLTNEGVRRLTRLARDVADHDDATAPLLDRFDRVDQLCACVHGTGGENALRMRLSAYVVAARLEEVAAAATERLAVMSGGRYALVHSDERVKGGGRSGLGLRVSDGWTGVERDTATLSGGETFVASLALALGLADVVQAEAGGTTIETLFVDEGFGTLDEDTLDDVMTTLDGLRDGGRAVGLVSHVVDLRSRIPTQLEVRKTRAGSTLSQHAPV